MLFTKNNPPPGFYVYAYLRKSDLTPYYIGKGIGLRAWGDHHFNIPKDTSKIIILEANLTELGSLALERRMIRWYGRKDLGTGILRNMTDGGDGIAGYKAPLTDRLKYSKPGSKNGMFGKTHTDKVKQASSIRRVLTNKARNWYNNGTENKFVKESPGADWSLGRIQIRRWYNNGVKEIYTTDVLPNWALGRLKGNKK